MAEDLCISNGGKEEKYRMLLPQIKCLIEGEDDLIANLANVAAALKETFHFFWVGFYLVKGEDLVHSGSVTRGESPDRSMSRFSVWVWSVI